MTIDGKPVRLTSGSKVGIYVHIPFCRQKCLYCDFCSFPGVSPERIEAYTERLCSQIREICSQTEHMEADTVFFGGGTPTLLSEGQWDRILSALQDSVRLSADAEITTECNPATAGPAKLKAMRTLGINRLSVGVQSIHPGELRTLGRIHTEKQFEQLVRNAREAGFERISFDLMFGFPGQTEESWLSTLRKATGLNPEHLSVYALQLEEGTPLYRDRASYVFPDEDTVARMYDTARTFLEGEGFSRYEVSNYARPGCECRHNLKYWNCEDYLGFGISAHSLVGRTRFYYPGDMESFLRGTAVPVLEEQLSDDRMEEEYAVLRLRLSTGLDMGEAEKRFGDHFARRFLPVLRTMADRHLLICAERNGGEIYRIPDPFFFTENDILSELLACVQEPASFSK